MKSKFRENHPQRTYSGKKLSNYRDYKPFLRADFNKRCGYTDAPDYWFGGVTNFHIDHFLPHSIPAYLHLKTEYGNLIYTCSHINIAKSNDEGLFLDPCDVNFNEHFWRNEYGEIVFNPESKHAKYMYYKLKMYLMRYSMIWILDNILRKMEMLKTEISKYEDSDIKNDLLILQGKLANEFVRFSRYHSEFQ
jgi:hypothetical protein